MSFILEATYTPSVNLYSLLVTYKKSSSDYKLHNQIEIQSLYQPA